MERESITDTFIRYIESTVNYTYSWIFITQRKYAFRANLIFYLFYRDKLKIN